MRSILFTHRRVINTADLKQLAKDNQAEGGNFKSYSKKAAQSSKVFSLPVLYVNGNPTTKDIADLINDRLIFIVCLFPDSAKIEDEKVTEFGKVFSNQPWFLNLAKIRVLKANVTKDDDSFDFESAQQEAAVYINDFLNTEEGQILAAALPRIVPEGVTDTWGNGGNGVTTSLNGVKDGKVVDAKTIKPKALDKAIQQATAARGQTDTVTPVDELGSGIPAEPTDAIYNPKAVQKGDRE